MTDEEKAEKYVNETFGRTNSFVAMTYTNIYLEGLEEGRKEIESLAKTITELKTFCKKLIKENNELRNSLRKYEIVPYVDYLPNGSEVYKENVGDNPYGIK